MTVLFEVLCAESSYFEESRRCNLELFANCDGYMKANTVLLAPCRRAFICPTTGSRRDVWINAGNKHLVRFDGSAEISNLSYLHEY